MENLNQKASILVVDDDVSIRRTLSRILERKGYATSVADSGKRAVELSKKRFFNVALIDIRLPDMEGTELLDRLKETEPKMVKIILTGYPSLKNAIEAVNKRADGYLLKPFDVSELLIMIAKQLEAQSECSKFSERRVIEYIQARTTQVNLERWRKRAL